MYTHTHTYITLELQSCFVVCAYLIIPCRASLSGGGIWQHRAGTNATLPRELATLG